MKWNTCIFWALLLAVFLPGTSADTGPTCWSTCTRERNHKNGQHCERCDVYVACVWGRPIVMPCPAGLVWDNSKGICDWSSTTCSTTATTTTTAAYVPPRDGVWSLWDPWSECTTSCGGGNQERYRQCDDPAPQGEGADCAGREEESRDCNTFACPDCARVCPGACTSNGNTCGVCDEAGNVFTGRVRLCNAVTPLGNVEVYDVNNLLVPLTETLADGTFTLSNLCSAGLELAFKKSGYTPVHATYISSFDSVQMCATYLDFDTHPVSTATFAGNDITLTCQATGLPAVTHYDWFKDFMVISYGDEIVGDSSSFTITAATQADSGVYQCRAVSPALKKFSAHADVIVRDGETDTCAETPLVNTKYLDEGCIATVNGNEVSQLDIGICPATTCAKKDELFDPENCCGRTETETFTIECNAYSYVITGAVKCGCLPCPSIRDVEISGTVRFVSADDPTKQTVPDTQIQFYHGSDVHLAENDGSFSTIFPATYERVSLQFRGGRNDNYIPNLVTVALEPGKDKYIVQVLLQTLPTPISLDPTQENNLEYGTTGGLSSMATLLIPANSMTFENGDLVTSGTIDAYVVFNDPRVDDSLALSPGEFSAADSDGVLQNLETGGVLGLHLIHQGTGNIVILPGNVQLTLDLSQSAGGMSTWQLDSDQGNWNNPDSLASGSGRKKRQADGSTDTSFPASDIRYLNVDKIDINSRCWVKVYVYRDENCTNTASGISVFVYSKDAANTVARTTGYISQSGYACIPVPCGRDHEILLSTPYDYVTSDTHQLPTGFSFTNSANKKRVVFASPAVSDPLVTNGDGPVHTRPGTYQSDTCVSGTAPNYHFKFIVKYPKPGELHPTVETPGLPGSWYSTNNASRVACMVRVAVKTDNEMEVIGTSYGGEYNYGYYETGLLQAYSGGSFQNSSRYACVEVKCPDGTGTHDPRAVVVNLKPTPNNCTFSEWYNHGNIIEPAASTDNSITFLMKACNVTCDRETDDGCEQQFENVENSEGRKCYDPRLFKGYGEGKRAVNNAFSMCIQAYWSPVATFSCIGNDTVTSTPQR